MNRRLLYLPIEVKPRELYGKLLLAAKAVERGWQVRLGRDREVRAALPTGPRGVFIDVNIPEPKANEIAGIVARGHRLVNLCEESIVYYGGRDYCQRKIGPSALGQTDLLLVVGERNADDLRRYRPQSAQKMKITGNPRFDVLRPDLRGIFAGQAASIRRRFGRFLLVNTNFGPVNHVKRTSAEILAGLHRLQLVADVEHADMLERWHDYKRAHLTELKVMLGDIARAGRYDNIVVRPHPTENHDSWREWAEPLGIKVHFEGSANNWMLAAAALLHTGCTTAVEGVLLDLPVVSFVLRRDHEMLNQADEISEQVTDAAEFLAADSQPPAAMAIRLATQREKATHIVANAEPPLSVGRILAALDTLDVPEVPVQTARANVLQTMRTRVRHTIGSRNAYGARKFDGLAAEEITELLAYWQARGVVEAVPALAELADGSWMLN